MGEDPGQTQEPQEPSSEPVPDFSPAVLRAYQDAVLQDINEARAAEGLALLPLSADGDAYAQERARAIYHGEHLGMTETRKFPGGQANYVRYCEGYDYDAGAPENHFRTDYLQTNWDEVAIGYFYDSTIGGDKYATWGIYLIDRAS